MNDVFPIMSSEPGKRRGYIPFAMLEPHRTRAWRNHMQTLERLRERGGLSSYEALCVLRDESPTYRTFQLPQERDAYREYDAHNWEELSKLVRTFEAA